MPCHIYEEKQQEQMLVPFWKRDFSILLYFLFSFLFNSVLPFPIYYIVKKQETTANCRNAFVSEVKLRYHFTSGIFEMERTIVTNLNCLTLRLRLEKTHTF